MLVVVLLFAAILVVFLWAAWGLDQLVQRRDAGHQLTRPARAV